MKSERIEWRDHCAFENRWQDVGDFTDDSYSPVVAVSHGFVVKETDDYLIIAGSMGGDEVRGAMCILKSCIIDRSVGRVETVNKGKDDD